MTTALAWIGGIVGILVVLAVGAFAFLEWLASGMKD